MYIKLWRIVEEYKYKVDIIRVVNFYYINNYIVVINKGFEVWVFLFNNWFIFNRFYINVKKIL